MIEREEIRKGFEKFHLNQRGEEDWPIRPVFPRITTPDPYYPHDHPAELRVHVLHGEYTEREYLPTAQGLRLVSIVTRRAGDAFVIPARRIHRIIAVDGECWTCCVYGPPEREPRFWRDEGRVEWRPLAWGGEWREWQVGLPDAIPQGQEQPPLPHN